MYENEIGRLQYEMTPDDTGKSGEIILKPMALNSENKKQTEKLKACSMAVMLSFMCQLGWVIIPRYLIKCCSDVSVNFLDETNIYIGEI